MSKILNGKEIAKTIKDKLKEEIKHTNAKIGFAAILVGNDEASKIYVNLKQKAAEYIGIDFQRFDLSEDTSEKEVIDIIKSLNKNPHIHGILVQLPLPSHLNTDNIILQIDPLKDADGFHPENTKLLFENKEYIISPPISAIMRMIEETNKDISGKQCLIMANSHKFADPIKHLLERKGCRVQKLIKEKNFSSLSKEADILITAIGRPRLIKAEDIKQGAILIDVGISRLPDGKVAGDLDFESVKEKAGYSTPVPGGIGPLTVAYLFYNTFKLYKKSLYQNAQ